MCALHLVLTYYFIVVPGEGNSEGATLHFQDLCTNKPQQTQETLIWCNQFANVSFLAAPNVYCYCYECSYYCYVVGILCGFLFFYLLQVDNINIYLQNSYCYQMAFQFPH